MLYCVLEKIVVKGLLQGLSGVRRAKGAIVRGTIIVIRIFAIALDANQCG